MEIDEIRTAIRDDKYRLTVHTVVRSKERGITTLDMEEAILGGEIIEE